MKDPRVFIAAILGIAMIISTSMMATAIKSFGGSLETAARLRSSPSINIPSSIYVSFAGGNSPGGWM